MLCIFGLIWSAMTFVQSLATNFTQLLIPRILMEMFAASSGPIGYSLIADTFSQKYRARAGGIYNLGIYLGISFSSLSTLLVSQIGWRNGYIVVSVISILIAFLTGFIKEPIRGRFNVDASTKTEINTKSSSIRQLLMKSKTILANKTYLIILAAMTLRYFGAYGLGFWSAKFYKLVYPEYQNIFSLANVVITSVGGMSSVYIGGLISDKLEPSFLPIKGMVAGIGALIGYPLLFFAFAVPNGFWVSITIYFISCFFGEAYASPTISMIQAIFSAELIGTSVAIILFGGGISGAISTFILGLLSDYYQVDDNPQRAGYLLAIMGGISYLGGVPLFIWSSYSYRNRMINHKI